MTSAMPAMSAAPSFSPASFTAPTASTTRPSDMRPGRMAGPSHSAATTLSGVPRNSTTANPESQTGERRRRTKSGDRAPPPAPSGGESRFTAIFCASWPVL